MDKATPEQLYLDLMKKTLTYSLWPEPLSTYNYPYHRKPFFKGAIVSRLTKELQRRGILLARDRKVSEQERLEGVFLPQHAHTMIGCRRLDNIQYCIEEILAEDVQGDFIETGVWRGGACIFMCAVLATYGIEDRKVYVADSFKGLPPPDADKYPEDSNDKHYTNTNLAISRQEVEDNFRKYGFLNNQVVFLEGWFNETLPKAPIEKLSLLRLDGDMYGSTMESMTNLYPKLSEGGFCIVDDHMLKGCRSAIHDYRARHNIDSEIMKIDSTGVYWKKH